MEVDPVVSSDNIPEEVRAERAARSGLSIRAAELRDPIRRRLFERGITGEDLEDLIGETLLRIIAAADRNTGSSAPSIEHPTSYALTVADTVFDDHLRRTRPNWYRLKRRILYLLDGNGKGNPFAHWRLRYGWLGGFARWRGEHFRATVRYRDVINAESRCPMLLTLLANRSPAEVPLPELLAALFRFAETPIEVNELTTLIAHLQQISEPALLSFDEVGAGGPFPAALATRADEIVATIISEATSAQFQTQLWGLVCELPVRQRLALLLSMERDELLLLGTITRLANVMEIRLTDFVALWSTLPLTDQIIATRLNITPKQTANLRKCARERLGRALTSGNR